MQQKQNSPVHLATDNNTWIRSIKAKMATKSMASVYSMYNIVINLYAVACSCSSQRLIAGVTAAESHDCVSVITFHHTKNSQQWTLGERSTPRPAEHAEQHQQSWHQALYVHWRNHACRKSTENKLVSN